MSETIIVKGLTGKTSSAVILGTLGAWLLIVSPGSLAARPVNAGG